MDLIGTDGSMDARLAALSREVRTLKRALAAAGVVAVALASLAIARPRGAEVAEFEEIDVGRINVREPDGTLRFVLSNRSQFPGDFYLGNESARPDRRDVAGLLFVNDEGTENGGLIQHGVLGKNGVEASLSLTFDRFRQDQVLQLLHAEQNGATRTGVIVNDRPDPRRFSIADLKKEIAGIEAMSAEQREAKLAQLREEGHAGAQRAYLGTTGDRGSALTLCDAQGRTRLLLLVPAQGAPLLQVLDEKGHVTGTLAVTPIAPPAKEPPAAK